MKRYLSLDFCDVLNVFLKNIFNKLINLFSLNFFMIVKYDCK